MSLRWRKRFIRPTELYYIEVARFKILRSSWFVAYVNLYWYFVVEPTWANNLSLGSLSLDIMSSRIHFIKQNFHLLKHCFFYKYFPSIALWWGLKITRFSWKSLIFVETRSLDRNRTTDYTNKNKRTKNICNGR